MENVKCWTGSNLVGACSRLDKRMEELYGGRDTRDGGRDGTWDGMEWNGRIVIVGQAFGDDDRTSKEDVGGWVE